MGWGAAPDETADAGSAPATGWGASPDEAKPEMPGVLEATRQGFVKSLSEYGQGVQALKGQTPQVEQESPAAAGYEWSDILHPSAFAAKTAYGLAHSAPSLAGGILGGAAGTMVEPGLGTLAGGALGAGAAAAAQQIGPAFAAELKATPNDPDGAWDRAIGHAAVSGAGSAAGWALFPAKFAEGPLKNLMFQAFGVQPGVSVAEQAAQNVVSDKPLTEGWGQAYAQGAVGSAIPLAGHAALSKLMARPGEPKPKPAPETEPTPQAEPQARPTDEAGDIAAILRGQEPRPAPEAEPQTEPMPQAEPPTAAPEVTPAEIVEPSRALVPQQQMFLRVGGKNYPIDNFQQASEMVSQARDTAGVGASEMGMPVIVDQDGKQIGHVSYNGRVWPGESKDWVSGTKPLYDNREAVEPQRALAADQAQDKISGEAPAGGGEGEPPTIGNVAAIGDKTLQFPDPYHAALFDLGRRLRNREQPPNAELQPLFDAFKGYIITDPEFGQNFNNLRDLRRAAREYYDDAIETARPGETHQAGVAIEPDLQGEWFMRQMGGQQQAQVAPGKITYLRPSELTVDASRFQYKSGANAKGVTGALGGVEWWDDLLANPILVWQGLDGRNYVVNGHQRFDLASRAQAAGQDVQMPARIMREADGFSPEYMKQLGAFQNIAEGSGTPLDAARILRAVQNDVADQHLPELPPRSALVQDGKALATLSNDAFGMVENGIVPEAYAAQVGKLIKDPAEQVAAMRVLAKAEPANADQARLIVEDIKNSGYIKEVQTGLFGDEEMAKSLIAERAKILDAALKALRSTSRTFKTAVEHEDTLAQAGNRLERSANEKAKADNERLAEILKIDGTRQGDISTALTEAARELAAGARLDAIKSKFILAVRKIVGRGDQARVQSRAAPDRAGFAEEEQRPIEPVLLDRGQTGQQYVIPGAEQRSAADLAKRKAAEPLKPRVAQKPLEEGLFGDQSQQQRLPGFDEGHDRASLARAIRGQINAYDHPQLAKLSEYLGRKFSDEERARMADAMERGDYQQLNDRERAAVDAMGAGPPSGSPPSGGPPNEPPGPDHVPPEKQTPDPSTWDRIPFAQTLKKAALGWKKTFQPELISDLSQQASGFVREYISGKAQGNDAITHQYYELRKLFNGMDPQQQIDFMKAAAREGTTPAQIPPELLPAYRLFREDLDMTGRMDQEAGSKMGWIEDYMPRMYENPEGVKQYMLSRVQGMGGPSSKTFQKARSFDFLQDALDAGYKLKYPNPADAVAARLMAGNAFRAQMKLMRDMENIGAAVKADAKNEPGLIKTGYEVVTDPSGQKWGLHPDVAPLWSNAIAQKGLWGADNLAGDIFRGWMNLKNAYVPIKLGLSAFHPLHVAHINLVHGMALGWRELMAGNPGKAFASTVKGVTGQFHFPEATAAKAAWLTPEWRQTPEQKAVVKLMAEGGFSPQLSEQLRMAGAKAWSEALANSDWKGMLKVAPYEAMRKTQGLIFEKWIPSLKTAAYLQEAKSLFERRPDLLDNEVLRRAALGTIAKSIDNRFGEMFYSNLHWNKMFKEAGIASFLSLGWNLGFLREFGGGALEPFIRPLLEKTPTREAVHAAQNKTAFALIYMANAMVLNAVMQKALSGDWPNELMDYFLPKIGGTNPDGSPRRISNMFYTREIPMMEKHIEEQGGGLFGTIKGLGNMLWNKMMFQPIKELWDNRDYYGYQIMDPSKPEYVQLGQLAKHILSDQFNPITITGAKNALKLSGEWDPDHPLQSYGKIFTSQEGLMALMGFGPAPSYASHSAVQNKLYHLYGEYVSPQAKPQADREIMEARRDARNALRIANQAHDPEKINQAMQRLQATGASKQSIKSTMRGDSSDIYLFERLPVSVKQQFLKELSPQDFKKFYPKSGKQVKANPEIQELVRRYSVAP